MVTFSPRIAYGLETVPLMGGMASQTNGEQIVFASAVQLMKTLVPCEQFEHWEQVNSLENILSAVHTAVELIPSCKKYPALHLTEIEELKLTGPAGLTIPF
jgi:hypothetical protein